MKAIAKKIYKLVAQGSNLENPDACLVGLNYVFTSVPAARVLYIVKDGGEKVIGGALTVEYTDPMFGPGTMEVMDNQSSRFPLNNEILDRIGLGEGRFNPPLSTEEFYFDHAVPWLFLHKNRRKRCKTNIDAEFRTFVEGIITSGADTYR